MSNINQVLKIVKFNILSLSSSSNCKIWKIWHSSSSSISNCDRVLADAYTTPMPFAPPDFLHRCWNINFSVKKPFEIGKTSKRNRSSLNLKRLRYCSSNRSQFNQHFTKNLFYKNVFCTLFIICLEFGFLIFLGERKLVQKVILTTGQGSILWSLT